MKERGGGGGERQNENTRVTEETMTWMDREHDRAIGTGSGRARGR